MLLIEKFKNICRSNPRTVLFAEANDQRIIQAARYLKDSQLAHPILIGGKFEVREIADDLNISTRGLEIINHNHQKDVQPFLEQLLHQGRFREYSRDELEIYLKDVLIYTLTRLYFNKADFAVAGNLSSMEKVARAALAAIGVCPKFKRASAYYLLFSTDQKKIYLFTDCSINVNPSAENLAEIAVKCAEKYIRIIGLVPRVAFLSFSTKGSANHQGIEKVTHAVEIAKKINPSLICDGEIQFDSAVDPFVAKKKGAYNSLNGKANVFIFPSLNSANIAQKIAEHIGGFISIGPMIQGLVKDVHHLPKSCTVENVINSVLLGSYLVLKNN